MMMNEENPNETMEQGVMPDASDPASSATTPEESSATDQPSEGAVGDEMIATAGEGTPEDAFSVADGETVDVLDASVAAETAALAQEMATLRAQLDDRNSQFMRIAADFDNFRKRTQKEKEELEQQIKCSTVIELLPVVDNFERARAQIKPQTEEGLSVHKSYQGVYKDLVDRLKRIGVAQMRCEGQAFDPNLHEAVLREATAEHAEGTVIEELVRGYTLGERVLRHAMVKVATPPEDDPSGAPEGSAEEASEA